MIRVLIADDQLLVRQGIRALLEMDSELEVAGEAGDGDETIELVRRTAIDVLLLDVRMPGKNGIEVLRELAEAGALPPALILTTFDDADVLIDAIRAGARGFLLKDVSYRELVAAIRAVAAGATVFQPAMTERLMAGRDRLLSSLDASDSPEVLTERELEVVQLMASGLSNREISRALSTAEGTIKNHVSSILSKLGVRDRTRAVLRVLELGWL